MEFALERICWYNGHVETFLTYRLAYIKGAIK